MVDAYEQKYGPVENRSEFDGEIIVPPHLRNMSLINFRPNRLHGGLLGSLSRSRTFLTLSTNTCHTFHGSVPDLSRNSCTNKSNGNNAILSKVNSSSSSTILVDVVNDRNCDVMHTHSLSRIQHLNKSVNDVEYRRKSEDQSYLHASRDRHIKLQRPQIYTTKPSEYRNGNGNYSSANKNDQTMPIGINTESYMTLIRTNIHSKSNNVNRGSFDSPNSNKSPLCGASSLHDINLIHSSSSTSSLSAPSPPPLPPPPTSFQHHSKSFSTNFTSELSLNVMSKYHIPRVSLSHNSIAARSTSTSPTNNQSRF